MNDLLLNEVYALKDVIADLDLVKEYDYHEEMLLNSSFYQKNKDYFDTLIRTVHSDEILMNEKSKIVAELSKTIEGINYLKYYRKIYAFYHQINKELFYPFYQ